MPRPWYEIDLPWSDPKRSVVDPADVGLRPQADVADPQGRPANDPTAYANRIMRAAGTTDRYSMKGLSPSDIMWVEGMRFFARQGEQDRDEADAAYKGTPGYIPGRQKAAQDAMSNARNLGSFPTPEQTQAYGKTGRPGATLGADPLMPYQKQVDALDGADYHDIMLPKDLSAQQAYMTIAGQLEARRRALGGAVSMGSPWNVVPGTF